MANRIGDSGNNILRGTSSDDTIIGAGGDDYLIGLQGQDTITGGDGNDVIFGDTEFLLDLSKNFLGQPQTNDFDTDI